MASLPLVDWNAVGAMLPEPAVRRTWLAQALSDASLGSMFSGMLKQLAPERSAHLRERTAAGVFQELLAWCDTQFPCFVFDDFEPFGESWYQYKIPIAVLGLDRWNDPVDSPALALALAMRPTERPEDRRYEQIEYAEFDCLDPYRDVLPADVEGSAARSVPYRLPRGRVWMSPWEGLFDLYAYAYNDTGYAFLDWDKMSMQEGDNFPDWNVGEVRALQRHWREAKPVWERICTLRDYIDELPRARLPLLAGALRHDPEALLELTRTAPGAPVRRTRENLQRASVAPIRRLKHARAQTLVRVLA